MTYPPGRTKSVLLVSYFFPPVPGAAPLRPGRLAKLLPRFGWIPTTLTGPWPQSEPQFGHTVARAPLGDPLAARIRGLHRIAPASSRWAPQAIRAGMLLARSGRFDAVVSISNPVANHVVAAVLAHRAGLPWLADYSEAWSGNVFAGKTPLGSGPLGRLIETRCLRDAAAITCATPGIGRILAKLHARSDIEIIENAVDFSEWDRIPSVPPRRFTFLFAGMLWGGRLTPELLFAAVARLRRAGHPAGLAARFEFYCHEHRVVSEAAARLGIEDAVRVHPLTARDRVLHAEREAAALVMLFAMRPISVVPSKLYEFYGARRPILAVGPAESKAQLGRLIEGNRLGHFATTEDECVAAVCALYERYVSGVYETDPDPNWSPPTVEATTARFAEILDRITGTAGACEPLVRPEEAHA